MIKSLEVIHLCRKLSADTLSRRIRTDSALLANVKRGRIPRKLPDEPGIRRRRALFQDEEGDIREEMVNDGDLEDEVDMMNIDRAYDLNMSERARNKRKLEYIITGKKFFAPRTQPSMLTVNERQCIRYLHKEDPVQWNIKTLSESFPATTDTIKKIVKAKWKITPERAKLIDEKVQKNWELLAKGELDADSHVLEHLKKFVNRREVLLEQIKNEKFYLPEVKEERNWKGEFSDILGKYESQLAEFLKKTELEQEQKMLKDGMEKNDREEDKSSLDLIRAKINSEVPRHAEKKNDSFLFKEMTKFYSKHTTLEDLEEKILRRADARKNLDTVDEAILETRFGVKSKENLANSSETVSLSEKIQKNMEESLEVENKHFMRSNENDEFITDGNEGEKSMEFRNRGRSRRFNRIRSEEMKFEKIDGTRRINGVRPGQEETDLDIEIVPPDERTLIGSETNVGEVLASVGNKSQPKDETTVESKKIVQKKPEIDFSDPERLERENIYYNAIVKDIESTAFWNRSRSSKEKALAEEKKRPHDGPDWAINKPDVNRIRTAVLSEDPYPERIKIPKNKQKSGLIFKVKDCFYDDDGEFLYRVPGMTK